MPTLFPAQLDNVIEGDLIEPDHLNTMQEKVGVDGSLDTDSIDYKLKNPSSIDPGHKHTLDSVNETATKKIMTDSERTKLAGIEAGADVTDAASVDAAGATMNTDTSLAGNSYFLDEDNMVSDSATKVPSQQSVKAYVDTGLALKENVANKATDFSTVNHTKYPSVQAVKTYADALVIGLLDDRGNYDASGNVFPSSGGSGTAGAILKGDLWIISVAGVLGGVAVNVGDQVRALTDTPGQTASNWAVSEANIGYVPENVANKSTDTALGMSDTLYPSQNAAKTYIDNGLIRKIDKAGDIFTGAITTAVVTLTDASTISVNALLGNQFTVTLGGNRTLENPSGAVNGQLLLFIIRQDGTGGRTLAFDTKFRFGNEIPNAIIAKGANKTTHIGVRYHSADDKFDVIAFSSNH